MTQATTNFSEELKTSYISFQFINKFYMDKFNLLVGGALDMLVEKNFDSSSQGDFGFVGGLGYDIMPNFGVEARVKKGIIPIISRTNTVFQIGAYYSLKTN